MMDNTEHIRKKVYVETTVVSDATALPTNDLTLAGRQMATREWWNSASAALNAMDYLVSWNFRHITNVQTIPLIRRICERNGYRCPEICTPQMLQKGDMP